jgi:hypothetical protein
VSAKRKHDRGRNRPERQRPRGTAKGRRDSPGQPQRRSAKAETQVSVRRVPGGTGWELVYPPSVLRRQEDLEEVQAMLAAGEIDVAIDELRWLLSGCRALLEAHKLLGEIALGDNDLALAQAHFGYAYEMGLRAIRESKEFSGPLSYAIAANQPFFEAGKGLAWCLDRQGEGPRAVETVKQLLALDPSDPLGVQALLDSFHKKADNPP